MKETAMLLYLSNISIRNEEYFNKSGSNIPNLPEINKLILFD